MAQILFFWTLLVLVPTPAEAWSPWDCVRKLFFPDPQRSLRVLEAHFPPLRRLGAKVGIDRRAICRLPTAEQSPVFLKTLCSDLNNSGKTPFEYLATEIRNTKLVPFLREVRERAEAKNRSVIWGDLDLFAAWFDGEKTVGVAPALLILDPAVILSSIYHELTHSDQKFRPSDRRVDLPSFLSAHFFAELDEEIDVRLAELAFTERMIEAGAMKASRIDPLQAALRVVRDHQPMTTEKRRDAMRNVILQGTTRRDFYRSAIEALLTQHWADHYFELDLQHAKANGDLESTLASSLLFQQLRGEPEKQAAYRAALLKN